jgi:hypothetical protein
MDSFKVVCINDKRKPSGVPQSSWIKEGDAYTVVGVSKMKRQRDTVGYKLAEVQMPADCEYQFYTASRFREQNEDDLMAEKAVEELLNQELVEI